MNGHQYHNSMMADPLSGELSVPKKYAAVLRVAELSQRWTYVLTHWHVFTVYISGITIHFTGGPGSGKLTQCQNVIKHYKKYKWVHLSIGDLLKIGRAHV